MPTNVLSGRVGTLLRVEFVDGTMGYADCHPWESCGDLPLKGQLAALETRALTPLLRSSLAFAQMDAQARAQNVPLLSTGAIPKSHWLAFDEVTVNTAFAEGFDRFKIKGDASLANILETLPAGCKLRPDFNSRLTLEQFESFLHAFHTHLDKFDYFEDPFPYHEGDWRRIQQDFRINLACDRLSERALGKSESARVVIVKPAVQLIDRLPVGQRLVVTSYLDHPLGQVAAAYTAFKLGCTEVCGLNSHRVYKPSPFSECLQREGPRFLAPAGVGFGFEDLLENLSWLKGEC